MTPQTETRQFANRFKSALLATTIVAVSATALSGGALADRLLSLTAVYNLNQSLNGFRNQAYWGSASGDVYVGNGTEADFTGYVYTDSMFENILANASISLSSGISFLDHDSDNVAFDFSGSSHQTFVDLSTGLGPRVQIGLSIGYENIEAESDVAGLWGDGLAVVPHFAVAITEEATFRGFFGWEGVDYSADRNSGAITSDVNSDRIFGGVDVGVEYDIQDKWEIGFNVGYFYMREEFDSYTESDGSLAPADQAEIGQVLAGPTVSYTFDTGWGEIEPYVSGFIEYDVLAHAKEFYNLPDAIRPNHDELGARFAVGFAVMPTERVDVYFGATTSQFRENTEEYSVLGTIKFDIGVF